MSVGNKFSHLKLSCLLNGSSVSERVIFLKLRLILEIKLIFNLIYSILMSDWDFDDGDCEENDLPDEEIEIENKFYEGEGRKEKEF